jgi:hypothetical protein
VKFVINLDVDPYDSPTEQTSAQPVADTGQ